MWAWLKRILNSQRFRFPKKHLPVNKQSTWYVVWVIFRLHICCQDFKSYWIHLEKWGTNQFKRVSLCKIQYVPNLIERSLILLPLLCNAQNVELPEHSNPNTKKQFKKCTYKPLQQKHNDLSKILMHITEIRMYDGTISYSIAFIPWSWHFSDNSSCCGPEIHWLNWILLQKHTISPHL